MTLSRFNLLLSILILLVSGCGGDDNKKSSNNDGSTTITISGAFALYPMMVKWTEEYQKLHPDVHFDVSAGGAGKGMSDVLNGAVDIAMVSREVRSEETDQGAIPVAVVKDAVVAVVNADNPVLDDLLAAGLTPEKSGGVWISGDITTWGELAGTDNSDPISVYTRADSSGAAEMWALYSGGEAQEDLTTGIGVQGDPGIAETVRQDRLGIGYNNIGFAYDLSSGQPVDGLRIIPLDLNGDGQISDDENFYGDLTSITAAIADGRYPSPPARPLYLVTKGQPNAAEVAFMRWILQDGQAFVGAAGYVQLPADQLEASLAGLPAQ